MKGATAMTVLTIAPPLPAVLPPFPVRRFTVDEYHQMIRVGIITEDDDVELLEGWTVPKMGRNLPHDLDNRDLGPMAVRELLP
jgi:hypothetical protein